MGLAVVMRDAGDIRRSKKWTTTASYPSYKTNRIVPR
jgi:hypothetical protein